MLNRYRVYHICSIYCPGRLFNFGHMRVGAYSRVGAYPVNAFETNLFDIFLWDLKFIAHHCFQLIFSRSRLTLSFSRHFQQARTFLENNKTRSDKFISLQQGKQSAKVNMDKP